MLLQRDPVSSSEACILFTSLQIELYNTTFQWSVATENGGALYLRVATEIQMSGVEFGSNTAKENGGAVSILGEPGMMLTDSSFRNNSAGLAVRTCHYWCICMDVLK